MKKFTKVMATAVVLGNVLTPVSNVLANEAELYDKNEVDIQANYFTWTEEQFNRWENVRDEFIFHSEAITDIQNEVGRDVRSLLGDKSSSDFTWESFSRLQNALEDLWNLPVSYRVIPTDYPSNFWDIEEQIEFLSYFSLTFSMRIKEFEDALANLEVQYNPVPEINYVWTQKQMYRWNVARDNFLQIHDELVELRSADFNEWLGGRERDEFTPESVRNLWEAYGGLMIELGEEGWLRVNNKDSLTSPEEQINHLQVLYTNFANAIKVFEYALSNLELLPEPELETPEAPVTSAPAPGAEQETPPSNNDDGESNYDTTPEEPQGGKPTVNKNETTPTGTTQSILPQAGQGSVIAPLFGLGSILTGLVLKGKKK